MLAIGGAAGAASFTHVHNVAAAHGQPGWLAWADAIVLELMSIASGLELRRRKRAHTSTVFPASVLACAVTLSLAAQVVEAEPSPIGWIAAAVPALGFLVMAKIALGYANTPTATTTPPPTDQDPEQTAQTAPFTEHVNRDRSAATAGERSTSWTVRPPDAASRPRGPDRRHGRQSRGRSAPPFRDTGQLLPAARQVRDQLAADGRPLTRAALADALRQAGHTVSNTRLSELLQILRAETSSTPRAHHDPPPAPSP
ncbi:DUF2637 domain-containing protein [Micromonospora sp. WMMD812]|uniref:DUF2637 domain-containing protein n=1 Tax=Micromonospora sp. WMMD812 TaxID=3015152 RepID=UPI00248B85C6|nr:DUF2637 domain-containing protein [Micromonospora sp. WMMD812]WBB69297.1 DUF2637 domain-containing protein [Micromonospora sp. WMMD812]